MKWVIEKSRKDKKGKRWNFAYWYSGTSADKARKAQRLAFWDDRKTVCGVVLFLPGATVPYSRISDVISKIVAHESFRRQHQRKILFPLEDHYVAFGDSPEEIPT
jgi:hypothetical protein